MGNIGANNPILENGFNIGNPNAFSNWDRKYPLRIVMDYVRSDGTKYTSTYYFYDGIFTYDWPPPATAAKPIFDADNREDKMMEKKVRLLVLVLSHRLEILWDLEWEVLLILVGELIWEDLVWKDLEWEDMIWEDMAWEDMEWEDMIWEDMEWEDMEWEDPGRKRPIIINVNNTGETYAPMEQLYLGDHGHHGHHGHPSSNVAYTPRIKRRR